jgi:enamine deaminase RidA (YjgF/YER057c/UK114 family)
MPSPIAFSDPDGVHRPLGPYAHCALVPQGTTLLFISGQVGVRPDGTLPEGQFAQADQIFSNLATLLTAHGMDLGNIVKLTTFYVGESLVGVREAREKHYGDRRTASTAVRVAGLVRPEWLLEVEAVAAK